MKNKMTKFTKLGAVLSVLTLTACGGGTETKTNLNAVDPAAPVDDWRLVWSDEFDGTAINTNNWTHEVNCNGGGNQEKQCYTDTADNSFVSDGLLTIVAKPAADGAAQPYTSARMTTQNKMDFQYGRVEMRAKLPKGQGAWPAFWMMPTDSVYGGWPKSGEIDIMEAVNLGTQRADGTEETNIYGTLHYGAGPASDFTGASHTVPTNPGDDFHTYAIEWQEGEIRWYMDGYLYATQRQSQLRLSGSGDILGLTHRGWYAELYDVATGQLGTDWSAAPFDQDFFMILNVAVGGNWPESVNEGGVDASAFTDGQTLEVDYVRVYKCSADSLTGRGCETTAQGYDTSVADGGKLVDGRAPSPSLNPGAATPLTIFDDTVDINWVAWDCCGGSTPGLVADDADRGDVYEFTVENGNDGTVFGFISRTLFLSADPTSPSRATPHNALGMIADGYVTFDLKVTTPPSDPDSAWEFKIEADEAAGGDWSTPITAYGDAPVTGEWSTYQIPLQDIADGGVDLTLLDVIMVFPTWMTGDGAVFRLDNVAIEQPESSGGGAPAINDPLFASGELTSGWSLWDCCGGTTPAVVADDAERGNVVEFSIADNNGTVLGFNSRNEIGSNTADSPYDATALLADGVLSFDFKAVSNPADPDSTWLIKVEGANLATPALQVPLANGNGGTAPVAGEWATYEFPIADILDAGVDITAIDVIMIFPAWQTGAGAVYRVDNLEFKRDGSAGPAPIALDPLFENGAVTAGWSLWDCCGGSTPALVGDTAERGNVVEFSIADNNGTVLGFNSRNEIGSNTADSPYDATSIIANGVLTLDFKAVAQPADPDSTWLIKVEGANLATPALQVPLANGNGGIAPVTGEWATYQFPIADILDAGVDVSAIDVVMIFPAWQTGAGAVYRVDNLGFAAAAGAVSGGGSETPTDGGTDGGSEGGETPTPEEPEVEVFAIGQEIIVDGGFDTTDSSAWTSGVVVVEGSNNVLLAEVSSAGDPWSVNVSQVLTVDPATNYVMTFKAKATEARNIIAGIGQNASPYYSNTEVVALTTEWQTYTLHLTSVDTTTGETFGDANSRVLFDLGAEVGDVTLDDVTLSKSPQLVVDSQFNNGITYWNAGTVVTEADNNIYFAEVTAAGDPWSVNLSQVLSLKEGKSYSMSFRAKASEARDIIAGIGLNAAPYHSSTEIVALTTEWQTFTYTFVANDDTTGTPYGGDNSRVLFDMGAAVGNVSLDDITVTELSGELIVNRDFNAGTDNWSGGATVTEGDNTYYQANVASAGDPWAVNLSQVLTLESSAQYVFTFKAKGEEGRTIIAGIGLNAAPYHSSTAIVTLTEEWTTYTYLLATIDDTTATPYGGDNSRVLFDMGADVGEVSLDDISVMPYDAYDQLVTNSDFAAAEGWTGAVLVDEADNSIFQVDVTAAGDPWAVNLSQVLTLIPETEYVLSFKAKSSVERDMIAGIGQNAAPYYSSTNTVNLTTEWQTFTYTLNTVDNTTGNPYGDDNSRVLFDMGAAVGMVSIDDVKLLLKK